MSHPLIVELSDTVYTALCRQAEAVGTSPENVVIDSLERELGLADSTRSGADAQAARERFERHFGRVDLGQPTGVDNEQIDADLAKEYADTHESE